MFINSDIQLALQLITAGATIGVVVQSNRNTRDRVKELVCGLNDTNQTVKEHGESIAQLKERTRIEEHAANRLAVGLARGAGLV